MNVQIRHAGLDPASPALIKDRSFHYAIAACSKNERIEYGMGPFMGNLRLIFQFLMLNWR